MTSLNLYLIKRASVDYDETSGAVIAAATPGDAREFATTLPGGQSAGEWFLPTTEVTLIGKAASGVAAGVVFSEYCPG